MECQTCSESLTAVMDGELNGDQEKELKTHLSQCSQCDQEYQSLLYSYELIDRIPVLELNPTSWGQIRAEIINLPTQDWGWIFGLRSFSPIRWIPVTAGALGLVFLSLFFLNQSDAEKERSFHTFLQVREQMELQHVNVFDESWGGVMEPLHPNPFALHDHTTQGNPFTLE